MQKLKLKDLMKLEDYVEQRLAFRAEVLEHKKPRKLHLGPHMTLLFEDRLTIQYQIQEMLRIEKIFVRKGIQEELDAYNPLIPDGSNWKATCLIEYEDAAERHAKLAQLRGIEKLIWAQVGDYEKIAAIANEDLERSNDEKTAAVHFLRFELAKPDLKALKAGAVLRFGVEHPAYRHSVEAPEQTRAALLADLK